MGVVDGRRPYTILLVAITLSQQVFGQANNGNACPCNCADYHDDILDLQERLICLESAMDEVAAARVIVPDCSNVTNDGSGSGIYQLSPTNSDPFDALCVFDEDGKWTVIQQRVGDDVDFNRASTEYQRGFGIMAETGSHWLGLDEMHAITRQRQYTLRIDVTDWDDVSYHADYSFFAIADANQNYAIRLSDHSGDLPDDLIRRVQGVGFSTFDKDIDNYGGNCAELYQGGWWFDDCFYAFLNGPYRYAGNERGEYAMGIIWNGIKGFHYSMKYARMRIRPTFTN